MVHPPRDHLRQESEDGSKRVLAGDNPHASHDNPTMSHQQPVAHARSMELRLGAAGPNHSVSTATWSWTGRSAGQEDQETVQKGKGQSTSPALSLWMFQEQGLNNSLNLSDESELCWISTSLKQFDTNGLESMSY